MTVKHERVGEVALGPRLSPVLQIEAIPCTQVSGPQGDRVEGAVLVRVYLTPEQVARAAPLALLTLRAGSARRLAQELLRAAADIEAGDDPAEFARAALRGEGSAG